VSRTSFLDTAYDEPHPALELPVKLTSGRVDAIQVADHVARGRWAVGRLTAPASIVALKIKDNGAPVRITMQIRLDWMATRWWVERSDLKAPPHELPRLVVIRSQGRVRDALVLARSHTWFGSSDARGIATFELAAGDVPEDGLLIIEIADAARLLPDWVAGSLTAAAPVGLQVDWIEVASAPGDRPPTRLDGAACQTLGVASAGGFVRGAGGAQGPARTGYLVVGAQPAGGELRLRLRTGRTFARVGPVLPLQGKWGRSLAGRAVAKGRRMAYGLIETPLAKLGVGQLRGWPVRARSLSVRAVSLEDGSPRAVNVKPGRLGRLDLVLDTPLDAPILVHISGRGTGSIVCKLRSVDHARVVAD
jgi:hypothetical protein